MRTLWIGLFSFRYKKQINDILSCAAIQARQGDSIMKRITRIIRPIICIVVLLVAMTTAVRGCYQRETELSTFPAHLRLSHQRLSRAKLSLGGQADRVGGSQSEESRHRGMAVYPRCGGGRPCDAGGGQRLQTIRRIPFRPSRRWWSLPTYEHGMERSCNQGYSEQRAW